MTGEGFYRNEAVTIYWDSTGSTGQVLTTTSANAFGEISVNVSIPDSAAGSHYIVGKGSESALQASRTYTVTGATAGPGEPRISIEVTTGFVGAVIEVTGTGYGVGESVEMFWDSTGSTGTLLKTVNADAAGSFATTITVPQATDGKHLIVGRGTVSNAKPSRSIMIQAAPEITSSPTTGAAASIANITGVRFFGSEQVDIFWDSTSGTPLSSVGANPDGGFTIGIAIPTNATTGEHDVIAKGRTSGFEASVAFDVTAPPSLGITIDPTTGPPGTSITVNGVGFGSNELVIIRWGNTSSGPTLGAVTASASGSFTTTVTAPNVADGSYRVIAHAQTSGKKPLKDFVVTSAAATPQIVFDPMSGVPGTTVTINGTGFEPAEQVNMRWDNTSSGLNLGSVTASGSGTFTTTITVPDASYGPHRLIAHGQTTNSKPFHDFTVTEPVIVDPRISIDPIQGRTGTVVSVSGTNYQPGERVEIRWNSSSSSAPLLGTATADNNGAFTTNVTIPNVEGGTYRIVGKGPVSLQNPTRSFTVTPSIGASTLTAQPGDDVRLTVRGFKAGETIEIYFDSVTSTPLATAQANSIGVAAITIVIPAAVNGSHQILAVGGATSAPPQPITITNGTNQPAEASFATSTSSPGDQPVIDLANFWSGERVEIFWDDRQTPTSSFVIGGDGSFSGEITVPTLPGGVHDVTVRGVDSGKSAVTTITLVPKVILTPPIGAVDARIVVDVKAWTPGATATIYFNRPEGGSGGTFACSATGRDSGTASCSFNVPSGFAVGTVVGVTATGSPGSATALFEVRNEPVGFAPAEETTEPEPTATEPTPEETPVVDDATEETPVAEPAETPAAEEPAPEPTPTEEPVVEAPTEEPTVEPTPVPEPRLVTSGAVSDVTVFSSRPDDAATEQFGMLGSGGAEGAVAYLTFSVEGIGGAVVTDARLVITGAGSTGGWESVSVVPGLWIDEASATWNGLPSTGLTAATDAGWAPVAMPPLANGETAWIDVTTSIQGDGVVTFVISGNPDALASFLSRESGNGPRLEITVQD